MTDSLTLDSFEQQIAAGLERYVAAASDPAPISEIAAAAMRPRSVFTRTRNTRRSRRLLMLGVAAVLLVPAAYFGATLLRLPEQNRSLIVLPSPLPTPLATNAPLTDQAVFIRRNEADDGLVVLAVRPDGTELLLRELSDSIVPNSDGTLSPWGAVSASGWLALSVDKYGGLWPMILVDLRNPDSEPWVVDDANLAAISPAWGPTGLVAASRGGFGALVIADPEGRSTRRIGMRELGLIGGLPSIVWTEDGRSIVGQRDGQYESVPIDGSDPIEGVGEIYGTSNWGPGLAELRICHAGEGCPRGDGGQVERTTPDGSRDTIWFQDGEDRALSAGFGRGADEYWLALDHGGAQVAFVKLSGESQQTVATINRGGSWQYVGAPWEAADGSAVVAWIDLGGKPAGVVVPVGASEPSFHGGQFAGFVDASAAATFMSGEYQAPAATMPPLGQGYVLPPLEDFIAAELALNPGERVMARGFRDGVAGEPVRATADVTVEASGNGQVYVDCMGPAELRAEVNGQSTTHPCLSAGSSIFPAIVRQGDAIRVVTSSATTWRVVMYSCEGCSPAE